MNLFQNYKKPSSLFDQNPDSLSNLSTLSCDTTPQMTKSLTFEKYDPEETPQMSNSLIVPQPQSRKYSLGGFQVSDHKSNNKSSFHTPNANIHQSIQRAPPVMSRSNGVFNNTLGTQFLEMFCNTNQTMKTNSNTSSQNGSRSRGVSYDPIDARIGFFEELEAEAYNLDYKKYINLGEDGNEEEQIDQQYVLDMLDKYKPLFNNEKGAVSNIGNIAKKGLGVSPMMIQYDTIVNYLDKKMKGKNVVFSSDDDEKEYVGLLTKSQRKKKIAKWREKQKSQRQKSSNTPRYGIRQKLARRRKRKHGRFVKNDKMKIVELLKEINLEKSQASETASVTSRKSSLTGLIGPFNQLKLDDDNDSVFSNSRSNNPDAPSQGDKNQLVKSLTSSALLGGLKERHEEGDETSSIKSGNLFQTNSRMFKEDEDDDDGMMAEEH